MDYQTEQALRKKADEWEVSSIKSKLVDIDHAISNLIRKVERLDSACERTAYLLDERANSLQEQINNIEIKLVTMIYHLCHD